LRCIDDQQRPIVVGVKKSRIAIRQSLQVSTINRSLKTDPTSRNPAKQGIDGCLQIDNKIRNRRINIE
jgi:hypothetical protein